MLGRVPVAIFRPGPSPTPLKFLLRRGHMAGGRADHVGKARWLRPGILGLSGRPPGAGARSLGVHRAPRLRLGWGRRVPVLLCGCLGGAGPRSPTPAAILQTT